VHVQFRRKEFHCSKVDVKKMDSQTNRQMHTELQTTQLLSALAAKDILRLLRMDA